MGGDQNNDELDREGDGENEMNGSYDEISKRVNEEIAKLGKRWNLCRPCEDRQENRDYPEERVGKRAGS